MRTLETERLILRDWQINDLEDYLALISNPNVTIQEGCRPRYTVEEALPILEYLINKKNSYALVLKSTGHVIGSIGLNQDAKNKDSRRNIGFSLLETYWNSGIMTEALTAVIGYAKEVTEVLSATHHPNNTTSKHLLTKFGFKQVDQICGVKRLVDYEPHDDPYYILEL